MNPKQRLEELVKSEAERIIRKKYKCLGRVADSNVTLGREDFIAGANLLAEPLLEAMNALYELRAIFMRRHGDKDLAIKHTPNGEALIIFEYINSIEKMLEEKK